MNFSENINLLRIKYNEDLIKKLKNIHDYKV